MSIKELEEDLNKIEAIQKYPELKLKYVNLENQHSILRNKLIKAETELSKFKKIRIEFGDKNLTLEELDKRIKEQTRKNYKEEVELEAYKKFKEESPSLVINELKKLLEGPRKNRPPILNMHLEKTANELVTNILKNPKKWPPWFKQNHENQIITSVSRSIDQIFWENVESKAQTRIHELISVEWPRFVQEKVTPFCQLFIKEQLIKLIKSIQIICDKCGTEMQVPLTHNDKVILIDQGFLPVSCTNFNCKDWLVRHKIKVHLGELILQNFDSTPNYVRCT
ncbi:MAG: hypothetical protein NWE90_07525 [Candidatus Bathyarchaeota archaeon]|nr:hypothetical protein [Candidatus Bathyarchaeota archaeon]